MSTYEELLDAVQQKVIDYDNAWDSSGAVARNILSLVFRTLETVTPEMCRSAFEDGWFPTMTGDEDLTRWYLAMLRASPLAPPKET